ncbi:hypothetical protein [Dyadobacter sp.]|uniref:hypothetical protein n=1 Tax=Dyadobacter sp. TaxID=1914288 RepID=UPI003F712734
MKQVSTAWVFENSREEMLYAGFTDQELTREISYSNYDRHISAKMRNVPLDSVKANKLFDKITSISLTLSRKELSYLSRSLLAIGFTRNGNSFVKDDFGIKYELKQSARFLVKEIGILLAAPVPKTTYSSGNVDLLVEGNRARMRFRYK